jgi:hypothetical protein
MSKGKVQNLSQQVLAQKNKITSIEKRMQGIFDEYTDLIDALAAWLSAFHANSQDELGQCATFTELLLEKMRKKYG